MRSRTLLILLGVIALIVAVIWWRGRETPYPIVNADVTVGAAAQTADGPIIAFGDSLTAGTGAEDGQSYPTQLERRLGVTIVNRGVPGNTTEEGLRRLENDVLSAKPRIVLVCLGGNDLMRRVPSDETFRNLEQIIQRIQERGALVILLGLDISATYDFDDKIRTLARQTGCPLVRDILGSARGNRDLMADTVHPNGKGYATFVEKVLPVIEKYLPAKPQAAQ